MGNDEFILHPGLIQDLEAALRRNGWTRKKVKMLATGDVLTQFGEVLDGLSEIIRGIDCDATPRVPNSCKVLSHRKHGVFKWSPSNFDLWCPEGESYSGFDVFRFLGDESSLLNACVLDFLLANPAYIPSEWEGKNIAFAGTVYQCSSPSCIGDVRCLSQIDGTWHETRQPLDHLWGEGEWRIYVARRRA